MWFKKNKQKLDSRVRFQSAQFTKKLGEARNYRRTAKPLPESSFQLWLTKIGLGSRFTQAGVLLIILGILYIIYIPNFLSVDKIIIEGLSDSDRVVAEGAVRESLSSAPFYNPQRNLVFLSKARMINALTMQGTVFGVESITKDFSEQSLVIKVRPKVETFTLLNGEKIYSIYNDGAIRSTLQINPLEWLEKSPANTILLKNSASVNMGNTKEYLSSDSAQKLIELNDQFKKLLGRTPLYIELQLPEPAHSVNQETGEISYQTLDLSLPVSPIEARAYLTINEGKPQTYYMIFDMQQDIREAVERLQLLLSQTSPERYQRLVYIDMRLPKKSFICLTEAVCAKAPDISPEEVQENEVEPELNSP
jgi:hypothetical protein